MNRFYHLLLRRLKEQSANRADMFFNYFRFVVFIACMLVFTFFYTDSVIARVGIEESNVFSYVLIGAAFLPLVAIGMEDVLAEVKTAIESNYIEIISASSLSVPRYTVLSACVGAALVVVETVIVFAVAACFTDASAIGYMMGALAIVVSVFSMVAFGVIMAAILLVKREVSSIMLFFHFPIQYFTGVFVPISLYPDALKVCALFIPLTPGIELVRHYWTGSVAAFPVETLWGVLIVHVVMISALGYLSITKAEKKVRITGV